MHAPIWLELLLKVSLKSRGRAFSIIWCYIRGYRVRARNRLRDAAAALLPAYPTWIATFERTARSAQNAREIASAAGQCFAIMILADEGSDRAAIERTLQSIVRQTVPPRETIVAIPLAPDRAAASGSAAIRHLALPAGATTADRLNAAIGDVDADFLLLVPPGAELAGNALACLCEAVAAAPEATLLFGDEDCLDADRTRTRPWFKPEWNAELVLAQDYVSRVCAVATSAARAVGPLPPTVSDCAAYALVLGISTLPGFAPRRVPHVLHHMPADVVHVPPEARCHAITHWFKEARCRPDRFGTTRVCWPLPDQAPAVAIIIPTRDRLDLVRACVDSVLGVTDYHDYTIVIIDNGSVEPETLRWFQGIQADPRVRVERDDRPYNFSALNNAAVDRASSPYVCLLNNDTEAIASDWLTEMMRHSARDDVGAVGAKLLYSDGTIQHAGVVIGLGGAAGHAHRYLPDTEEGYFAVAHSTHDASAVTAACMLVERAKFLAVGGFDEEKLAIAYNDVDLCLKLRRAGWRNIYTPHAVLLHHEGRSRGLDLSPEHLRRYHEELAVLQDRWGTREAIDPMHHPMLDRFEETYRLCH